MKSVTKNKMWTNCDKGQNMTSVGECDKCSKIWQVWQNMTDVTKPDKCYKMWQKITSVTKHGKCDKLWQVWKKSQRNITEMKGDKFEGVQQV